MSCVGTGKASAKGADSKKNLKKTAVAKPNSIKSLFMNSNVKKPAEVCDVRLDTRAGKHNRFFDASRFSLKRFCLDADKLIIVSI